MRCLKLILMAFTIAIPGPVYPDNPKAMSNTPGCSEEDKVCFRWAFGAVAGAEGERRFVPIMRDTSLQTGDAFKMLVQIRKPCYVYVVYRSPGDEWSLLFPDGWKQFETDYETSKSYYIPGGDAWFELDEQMGRETFYVLAASDRLKDLEALIVTYESAGASRRSELGAEILDTIRTLRRAHQNLSASAERPVAIAGNVRAPGKPEDRRRLDKIAVEISAVDFYCKAFTIEHR